MGVSPSLAGLGRCLLSVSSHEMIPYMPVLVVVVLMLVIINIFYSHRTDGCTNEEKLVDQLKPVGKRYLQQIRAVIH